jgi:MFS family permease
MATQSDDAAPLSTRFRGVFSPLNLPDFRRLITSNFLWWGTRFMELTIVGWLVLELTNSPWQVAVIGFYRSAPFIFAGFVSGPIIDRLGRRRTIVWSQGINFIVSAIIALLIWFDWLAFWHLAVCSIIIGASWSLDWPARRALMPDLVGKARTVDALLLENFGQNLSRIIGPFAGGSLIAAAGPGGAYSVLAATAGVSFWLLLSLSNEPVPRRHQPGRISALRDIREGLRYVRHSQPILGTLLITMVMNLLAFPYMTVLPVFARDVLNQGPVGLGILGASSGLGAFVGFLMINRLHQRISHGWIFAAGSCFQCLMLLIFALSQSYPLSLLVLTLSGIGQVCFGIMQSSIILLTASDEMRSRAMGTLVLAIGSGPLGTLQIGALAETFGAPPALAVETALSALLIVMIIVLLPGLRRRPEDDTSTLAPA